MPRKRTTARRRDEFTDDQFFELQLGPSGKASAFDSPFLRRAAWYEHKDELMESDGPGQRPWGFWEYEFGEHFDKSDDAVKALRRRGLLSEAEEAQLTAIREMEKAAKRERVKRPAEEYL